MNKIKHLSFALHILLLLSIIISCNNKEINNETSFQVNNLQGAIHFNNEVERWYISVSTYGTIDEVKMFFPNNMDNNFNKEGYNVVFSGNAFECDENIHIPAGYEYFCIELTTIINKL